MDYPFDGLGSGFIAMRIKELQTDPVLGEALEFLKDYKWSPGASKDALIQQAKELGFAPSMQWDEYFMLLAEVASVKSKDPSTQVGVFLVGADHVPLSLGFNGFPSGMPDVGYEDRENKYDRVIHGDMNALMFAGRDKIRAAPQPVTMYLYPFLTCHRCMVHAIQYGVRRFVIDEYAEKRDYHVKAERYAEECGAQIIRLKRTHQVTISKRG